MFGWPSLTTVTYCSRAAIAFEHAFLFDWPSRSAPLVVVDVCLMLSRGREFLQRPFTANVPVSALSYENMHNTIAPRIFSGPVCHPTICAERRRFLLRVSAYPDSSVAIVVIIAFAAPTQTINFSCTNPINSM